MRYDNLNHLVRDSGSTRKYFLSLPVETQIELHAHNEYIHICISQWGHRKGIPTAIASITMTKNTPKNRIR